MGIGKIDPEFAVREGWARDSDDEIYMDGYNAFIQVTTRDGTSGFSVKNDIGAVAFSSKSDGDGYVAKDLDVGVKTKTLRLQVLEGAVTGWVLTADAQGNATWQIVDASGLPAGTLDGYLPDSTGQEHYSQLSGAIQTILKELDGYSCGAGADIKVKVSANDTTAGFLNGKLTAGTGISLTENADGGNEDLSVSISPGILDGYAEDGYHRTRDELVHVIAEDSYDEVTRTTSGCAGKITNITTWTDSSKTVKIREEQFTHSGFRVTQAVTIQYNDVGAAVETLTEDFTYSGNRIVSITRTLI